MAKKGDRPHLYKKEGKVFPCAGTLLPATPSPSDMHPKKVTVLKVTGVELVTLSYF